MNDKENVEAKEKETNKVTGNKPSAQAGGGKYAGTIAVALFSGVVIGVVTGILFAPKKGEKTRKDIANKSKELYTKGKDTVTGAIDKTKEFTKDSKSKLDKVVDIITPKKKNSGSDSK